MTHEHVLHGCTPTPLASYLKALAVLRLVAEQAGDPDATGCWRDDTFVLRTRLAEDELVRFFLEAYEPTPLVAPWNGGSGFYANDNQDGIEPIAASAAKRFENYRRAIEFGRRLTNKLSLAESPKDELKRVLLQSLRNDAPEPLVRWIDAAVILSDSNLRYPPLLGTGGNDGRLDFTNNFMQRLGELFQITNGAAKPAAAALLSTSLLGTPVAALVDRAIGQFAPGGAGGPNASSGFEGASRINPWDFVLMLEGAVLLAASAARRLESSDNSTMSAPFTVRTRAATVGNAALGDDLDSRGEIWMPLWSAPFTLEETTALFSEGRAALGTRPARDGLDFARAVARLGVDRGIGAFQRFGFLMRSGKAYLATPLARVAVRRNARADLIDELEQSNWLGNVQRYGRDADAPNAFRAAAARLDAALFALTQRADRVTLQRVLRQLGAIDSLCATSPKAREAVPPVPELSSRWALDADDGSTEFGIAAAFAGLSLRGQREGKPVTLTLRPHLAPVTLDGASWDENSRLACWGPGPLARNLAAILHRRRLSALDFGNEGDLLASRTGATLSDVMLFIDGATDDVRIAELLAGLVCVDLRALEPPRSDGAVALPPAYRLLKPLFTAEWQLRDLGWLPVDRSLRLPAEIPARLASGDVRASMRLAWQRLRAIGVKLPGTTPPQSIGVDGLRLLAALMVPLTTLEIRRLLDALDLTPGASTETDFALPINTPA